MNHARWKGFLHVLRRDKYLTLMVLPGLVLLFVFRYIPIYGIIIAFQKYSIGKGVFRSEWVGLKNFIAFFQDPYWFRVTRNTFLLGLYMIVFTTPAPILLALSFNAVRDKTIKRVSQTISYLPNFVSIVIVVSIIQSFTSFSTGKINEIIAMFGGHRIDFLTYPFWFIFWYIFSALWQGTGFGAIIYLAALAGVNPELYEAAEIDGATGLQKARYIDIPAVIPTFTILLIFSMGRLVSEGDLQKILLMYNQLTWEVSDVIATYVYRRGIIGQVGGSLAYSTPQYSYAAAVGLMQSFLSLAFIYFTNRFARKVGETSLW